MPAGNKEYFDHDDCYWIYTYVWRRVDGSIGIALRWRRLGRNDTVCDHLHTNVIIQDIISALALGAAALLLKHTVFLTMNLEAVIIGAIMPLVPGVAITNAVRDTLQGDYVSGCARILEAFLKAAAIAIGVGAAMALSSYLP
ncbi:hypothetical protein DWX73_10775 [Coprococcus sp. AF21-14LB]|nr:hypothetical protein DWX73_10775 [Coprococcus sp. AF21-14LB]